MLSHSSISCILFSSTHKSLCRTYSCLRWFFHCCCFIVGCPFRWCMMTNPKSAEHTHTLRAYCLPRNRVLPLSYQHKSKHELFSVACKRTVRHLHKIDFFGGYSPIACMFLSVSYSSFDLCAYALYAHTFLAVLLHSRMFKCHYILSLALF